MADDTTSKATRIIIVRKEVDPKYVKCEECQAYEKFRRHPSEGTGECRRRPPEGVTEPLGATAAVYRAKWPVVFRDEGCLEGVPKN